MTFLIIIIVIIGIVIYFYYRKPKKDEIIKNPYLPDKFIVADVETTGLSNASDRIIEIAAIKVNPNSSQHITFQALVNPKIKISNKIEQITGINNSMLEKEGEPIEQTIKEFIEFIGDLPLVFYNAPFDMGFLSMAAEKVNKSIENEIIDALPMSRKAFLGLKNYKLTTVANNLGIKTSGVHRALKDCEITMHVYNFASFQLKKLSLNQGSQKDVNKREKPPEKPYDQSVKLARTQDDRYHQAIELENQGYIENAMEIYQELANKLYDASTPYKCLTVYYRKNKEYDKEINVIKKQIEMYLSPDSQKRVNIDQRVMELKKRIERVIIKKEKNITVPNKKL